MKNKLAAIASGMLLTVCLTGCTPSEVREAQDAIDAIGEVTPDSKSAIEDANSKYNALNEDDKEKVENYSLLEEANIKLPISEGDSLFGSGDYEGALQCYKSLESGDGYKAIFEHGVELFEKGEYSQCKAYMDVAKESSAVDSDAAKKYVQTCYALTDAKNDMSMLYRTDQLKRMDAEGFEPASRALENDAFAPYRKLSDAAGLYRSDNVIEHYDIAPETNIMLGDPYEVYSYIAIGSQLSSTVLAADGAKITMTLEKARERARKNDFDCDVHAVGDGRFHCKATYTDAITKKGYEMEFDIVLGDESLSVESLSTNENPGNETLCEGRYSKIS